MHPLSSLKLLHKLMCWKSPISHKVRDSFFSISHFSVDGISKDNTTELQMPLAIVSLFESQGKVLSETIQWANEVSKEIR